MENAQINVADKIMARLDTETPKNRFKKTVVWIVVSIFLAGIIFINLVLMSGNTRYIASSYEHISSPPSNSTHALFVFGTFAVWAIITGRIFLAKTNQLTRVFFSLLIFFLSMIFATILVASVSGSIGN